MAKEHRIVVNTIRISLTPGGVEGGGRGEISFLEIREHRPPIRVFTPPSRGYYVTARTGEGVEAVKREKEEKEEIPSL